LDQIEMHGSLHPGGYHAQGYTKKPVMNPGYVEAR